VTGRINIAFFAELASRKPGGFGQGRQKYGRCRRAGAEYDDSSCGTGPGFRPDRPFRRSSEMKQVRVVRTLEVLQHRSGCSAVAPKSAGSPRPIGRLAKAIRHAERARGACFAWKTALCGAIRLRGIRERGRTARTAQLHDGNVATRCRDSTKCGTRGRFRMPISSLTNSHAPWNRTHFAPPGFTSAKSLTALQATRSWASMGYVENRKGHS
jgi:hypothetical protein